MILRKEKGDKIYGRTSVRRYFCNVNWNEIHKVKQSKPKEINSNI
jgi:hypothetical protein